MQTAAAAWLAALGSRLADVARQFAKVTAASDIRKGDDDDKLTPLERAILKAAEEADHGEMVQQLLPHIEELAKDSAKLGVKRVAAGADDIEELLNLANDNAVIWADDHAAELITQVEDTTKSGVRAIVSRALDEGWTNDELADALEDAHEFSEDRAEMIARTETQFASINGNLEGWRASGVVDGKQLALAQDEYCAECEAMAEAYPDPIPLDAQFEFDGEEVDGPPFHPRCRCDLLPSVIDDESEGDEPE